MVDDFSAHSVPNLTKPNTLKHQCLKGYRDMNESEELKKLYINRCNPSQTKIKNKNGHDLHAIRNHHSL